MPPSTTSVVPVMKREAGEARKPTTSATSAGSPQRPSGVWERIQPSRSSTCAAAVIGVRIRPGATALTRMPRGPSSTASVSVSERNAAFVEA